MQWKMLSLRREGGGEVERLVWRRGRMVGMWIDHLEMESRASVGR